MRAQGTSHSHDNNASGSSLAPLVHPLARLLCSSLLEASVPLSPPGLCVGHSAPALLTQLLGEILLGNRVIPPQGLRAALHSGRRDPAQSLPTSSSEAVRALTPEVAHTKRTWKELNLMSDHLAQSLVWSR